jgi:hypothetical protein
MAVAVIWCLGLGGLFAIAVGIRKRVGHCERVLVEARYASFCVTPFRAYAFDYVHMSSVQPRT